MSKIRRNGPCPCGSGKKYKRCHGALDSASEISPFPYPIPQEVWEAVAQQAARKKAQEDRYGEVKDIISAELERGRLVAVGPKMLYMERCKVFPDFLGDYLQTLLGKDWGESQVKLPLEEQHPIVQWRTLMLLAHRGSTPNEQGLFKFEGGAANAWFRLAYDLYLVAHNAKLQRKLLLRLRSQDLFQGARFEAAVAAMMLASGYDLRYADERGPGKHPEFYATNRKTGQVLAVEAKSRHRPGILGFKPHETPQSPESFCIDTLLLHALEKDTEEPLLVFVDINVPLALGQESINSAHQELSVAWTAVQNREWPNGFPAVGVVFYNDASPWYLHEKLPTNGSAIWAVVLWPTSSRDLFDAKPLLRRIGEGCFQRTNVPLDFPQELL